MSNETQVKINRIVTNVKGGISILLDVTCDDAAAANLIRTFATGASCEAQSTVADYINDMFVDLLGSPEDSAEA